MTRARSYLYMVSPPRPRTVRAVARGDPTVTEDVLAASPPRALDDHRHRPVRQALEDGRVRSIVRAAQDVACRPWASLRAQIFSSPTIMGGRLFPDHDLPNRPRERKSRRRLRLLGTVEGDIHDIGKNMAALTFRMFGFTVEDLGINVPPERFLESVKAVSPDIVGMSGLLSVAFTSMRDTVALIKSHADELARLPVTIVGRDYRRGRSPLIGADTGRRTPWKAPHLSGFGGRRRPAAGPGEPFVASGDYLGAQGDEHHEFELRPADRRRRRRNGGALRSTGGITLGVKWASERSARV